MKYQETVTWLEGILPSRLQLHRPVDVPDDAQSFLIGTLDLGAESFATTVDFNRIDTGVVSEDSQQIRSELMCAGLMSASTAIQVLASAAQFLLRSKLPAQPGTTLPALADFADLPQDITARHGLLVAPFLWGGQVPQFQDDDYLVLPLQLILLTTPEFEYLLTYGLEDLQGELQREEVNINDLSRSVANS